ncbi:hypothetical protein MRX96_024653 [Rhipicephalus microplus]
MFFNLSRRVFLPLYRQDRHPLRARWLELTGAQQTELGFSAVASGEKGGFVYLSLLLAGASRMAQLAEACARPPLIGTSGGSRWGSLYATSEGLAAKSFA